MGRMKELNTPSVRMRSVAMKEKRNSQMMFLQRQAALVDQPAAFRIRVPEQPARSIKRAYKCGWEKHTVRAELKVNRVTSIQSG